MVNHLRPTIYLNAGDSVLEAVAPQTWDVLIRNLHLTTFKVHALIQTDVMVLWVLHGEINSWNCFYGSPFNNWLWLMIKSEMDWFNVHPPFWRAGQTWGDHNGSCWTKCPSEGIRPSPAWTSHQSYPVSQNLPICKREEGKHTVNGLFTSIWLHVHNGRDI